MNNKNRIKPLCDYTDEERSRLTRDESRRAYNLMLHELEGIYVKLMTGVIIVMLVGGLCVAFK